MKSFELLEPRTLAEAVALLDPEDTSVRALAGGTALMLMMKARLFQPSRLISLHRLNGTLRGVRLNSQGGLSIGALTSLRELERSPLMASAAPVIVDALRTLANVRVRNVATIGGHLAHGDPHMDLPPILVTLGARVRAVGARGERWIDISNFFVGYYQTTVAKDELIAEVEIPAQPAAIRSAYAKCTALSADDWPAVGAAVWYRLEQGAIAEARIAISAATERPIRATAAESALIGAPPESKTFARAADAAAEEVQTMADIRGSASYKREMVRVYARRALEHALRPDVGSRLHS
ncbi:MAG TPA: xanthine dehydrogenase family protein subunit M [Candidatus Acidoferrales bacterium]|jgi:carbon-monoxide dehydrogenase medium subunit|nr:xanthine dehydrogenase family protein subunit M [Candidatus Acidoferrales bacterium]